MLRNLTVRCAHSWVLLAAFAAGCHTTNSMDSEGEAHCDLGEAGPGPAEPVAFDFGDARDVAAAAPKNSRGLPLWESRPGARVALFLDFDGGYYGGTDYFGPASLDSDEDNFDAEEQVAIIRAAMDVASSYAGFDVNVTTDDAARRRSDKWAWILITNDKGTSGRAKIDVIGRPSYPKAVAGADAVFSPPSSQRGYLLTHELGHNFGLNHSGLYDNHEFTEWSDLKVSRTGAWMGGRSSYFTGYEWMTLQTARDTSEAWQDPIAIIGAEAGFVGGGGDTGGGDCHRVPSGDSDYCTSACPCDEGEGDCDNDAQCKPGLICEQQSGTDYCVAPDAGGGDCHTVPSGDSDYCTSACPCDEGEGDCDTDDQCAPGLVCQQQSGTDYCVVPNTDGGDCHTVRAGDSDYCTSACPCKEGEGDCDSDDQCASGLICQQQSGTDFCVVPDTGGGGTGDCHAVPAGDSDYCTSACPCDEGEGDCDNDDQCAPGLVCQQQSGTDFCVAPDTGGGSAISHVGSTEDYDSGGDIRIARPSGTRAGDLLVLFLSRTDDVLPFSLDGWTRPGEGKAACLKSDNGQGACFEQKHCKRWSGDYCDRFDNGDARGSGRDLGTVVFYRRVGQSEPARYSFNLRGSHPAWAIVTALRGANTSRPFRSAAGVSCDRNRDSRFAAVDARSGDMLLLSQAFDDTVSSGDFRAPSGMDRFMWTRGSDEAGHVYGTLIARDGATDTKTTRGDGGSSCKDALISLVVRPGGVSASELPGQPDPVDDGPITGGCRIGEGEGTGAATLLLVLAALWLARVRRRTQTSGDW